MVAQLPTISGIDFHRYERIQTARTEQIAKSIHISFWFICTFEAVPLVSFGEIIQKEKNICYF